MHKDSNLSSYQNVIHSFNNQIETQNKILQKIAGININEEIIFGTTLQKVPPGLHLEKQVLFNNQQAIGVSKIFQTYPFQFFTFFYTVENSSGGANIISFETQGGDDRWYQVDTQSISQTQNVMTTYRGLLRTLRVTISTYGSGAISTSFTAG